METTGDRLKYYERMKENARHQKANHAFGFWVGAIATEKAAQHRMHLAALGGALIGFILGSGITAIYFVLAVIGGR